MTRHFWLTYPDVYQYEMDKEFLLGKLKILLILNDLWGTKVISLVLKNNCGNPSILKNIESCFSGKTFTVLSHHLPSLNIPNNLIWERRGFSLAINNASGSFNWQGVGKVSDTTIFGR